MEVKILGAIAGDMIGISRRHLGMGASSPKMRIEKRKSARLPFLRVWMGEENEKTHIKFGILLT